MQSFDDGFLRVGVLGAVETFVLGYSIVEGVTDMAKKRKHTSIADDKVIGLGAAAAESVEVLIDNKPATRKDLKELVAKAQQEVVTEFEAREEALRKETVEAHKIAQDAKTAQQAAEKTLAEYRVRFASIANQLKQARNGRIGVRKPLFKKVKKG